VALPSVSIDRRRGDIHIFGIERWSLRTASRDVCPKEKGETKGRKRRPRGGMGASVLRKARGQKRAHDISAKRHCRTEGMYLMRGVKLQKALVGTPNLPGLLSKVRSFFQTSKIKVSLKVARTTFRFRIVCGGGRVQL